MHRIFGTKENNEYIDREGVYLIPVNGNKLGLIHTSKGYFLLGGGLNNGESHIDCIERECMEEAGYAVSVKEKVCSAETYCKHPSIGYFHQIQTYYVGELTSKVRTSTEADHEFVWVKYDKIKGKLYAEMQNWALEQCADYVFDK